MKATAIFLALCLCTAPLLGQEPAAGTESKPRPSSAQSAGAARPAGSAPLTAPQGALTAPGGAQRREPGSVSARAATSKRLDPVKLWNLVESGGWAMIPLGFLSVLTGMLVLVYLFTLRRGSIVSAHYMNTADVLLKKRDYLGLLAISNRHSEAVARVVRRTLDFLTKNPNATYEVVREIAETEGQGAGGRAAAPDSLFGGHRDLGSHGGSVGNRGGDHPVVWRSGQQPSWDGLPGPASGQRGF